jgi:hypothetical protein
MRKSSSGLQGIKSSQKREVGVRTGASATGVQPAFTNVPGNMRGDHATELGRTRTDNTIPMYDGKTPPSVVLGNQKALDVGRGGPGTGRTVMRSGSQGQHGDVAGKTKPLGRDILSDFGPDIRGRR